MKYWIEVHNHTGEIKRYVEADDDTEAVYKALIVSLLELSNQSPRVRDKDELITEITSFKVSHGKSVMFETVGTTRKIIERVLDL